MLYVPKVPPGKGQRLSDKLVPFHFLTKAEWAPYFKKALDFVRFVYRLGFEIKLVAGAAAPMALDHNLDAQVPLCGVN